MTPFLWKYFTL